jgi:hypothetical protein
MVDDLLAAGAVIYISRFRSFDNLGSARQARQTFASEPTWLVISVMFCVSSRGTSSNSTGVCSAYNKRSIRA